MRIFISLAITAAAFLLLSGPLTAQEVPVPEAAPAAEPPPTRELEVFHDTLLMINTDSDSAPSPILSVWGASLRFPLKGNWQILPQISFSYEEYLFHDGKAFPAEIEEADAAGALAILLSAPVGRSFPLAKNLSIFAGTSPALAVKIPLTSYGEAGPGDLTGYFFGKARFITWEVLGALEWQVFSRIALCLRARVIFPLHRFWDGDGLPFYDRLTAGLGASLRVKL